MAFPAFRSWIDRRREDLENELELLEALQTPRSTLFLKATAQITDRAVAVAGTFTNGEVLRAVLEGRIGEILTEATPQGLESTTAIDGADTLNLFLNEALVLLGLVLKASTQEVVEGLIRSPALALKDEAQDVLEKAAEARSLLIQVKDRPLGQGSAFLPNSPTAEALERDLETAQEVADRMLANIGGTQGISDALADGVHASLQSALETLSTSTGTLEETRTLTESLVAAGPAIEDLMRTVDQLKTNLVEFRARYEASFRGISADKAQGVALSSNIAALLDQVKTSRTVLPDLQAYRKAWSQELAVLIALSRESKGESPRSVFSLYPDLAARYEGLKGELASVPVTDLSQLTQDLISIQGFLIGIGTQGFSIQMETLVLRIESNLSLVENRARAIVSSLDQYVFAPSSLVDELLTVVGDSKIQTAEDALRAGDIQSFLQLSVGNLNPIDVIKEEIRAFADSGVAQGTDLVGEISFAFQGTVDFEQEDMTADQGFENARNQSILTLQRDLARLDRLDSLLDKAETL